MKVSDDKQVFKFRAPGAVEQAQVTLMEIGGVEKQLVLRTLSLLILYKL